MTWLKQQARKKKIVYRKIQQVFTCMWKSGSQVPRWNTWRCWWESGIGTFAWWLGAWWARTWWVSQPPQPGSSPVFQACSSTGNWAVFLHLHYKIEDFVKSPFFNEKTWQKIPCRDLSMLCCTVPFLFAFSTLAQDPWDRTYSGNEFVLLSYARTCLSAGCEVKL